MSWSVRLEGHSDDVAAADEEAKILADVQALVQSIQDRAVSGVTGEFVGQHVGTTTLGAPPVPGQSATDLPPDATPASDDVIPADSDDAGSDAPPSE